MSAVPYTLTPAWAHWVLYIARMGAYGMLLTSGIGAFFFTPTSIADAISIQLTDSWGVIAMLGAALTMYGSARELYRWELAGLPLTGAAMIIYGYTVWVLTADMVTRLAQAGAISSLVLLLFIRTVDLTLVWRRALAERRMERAARARIEASRAAE